LALASDIKTFGEGHPNVAIYRNNLGGAWQAKGEYDKAIGYLELAYKTLKEVLGEQHRFTLPMPGRIAAAKAAKE